MPVCPRRYVEAPAATPHRFGLFSVAQFPPGADHWECGVEYEPDFCQGPAFTTHDPCNPAAGAPPVQDKHVPRGVDLVQADPFTIFHGFQCSLVGRTLEDIEDRARRRLALGAQRAVEFAFWTGVEGQRPRLADPSAVILSPTTGPTAGQGLSPKAALAALEDYIGREFSGEGTIHAPRGAAPYFHDYVERQGTRIETMLGSTVAFGGGYSTANTGPDGAIAPPGRVWAYATGPVSIWRSDPWINPTPIEQAFDKRTNTVELLVEQTYVVSYECVLAAVLIDLTCCPC